MGHTYIFVNDYIDINVKTMKSTSIREAFMRPNIRDDKHQNPVPPHKQLHTAPNYRQENVFA